MMNTRMKKKHPIMVKYRDRHDKIHTKACNRCCIGIIEYLFDNDIDGRDAYVYVYASEIGREPHFHLESKNGILHTAILFKEAAYYMDSTDQIVLSGWELLKLNDGLKNPSKIPGENIWQRSLNRWNFDCFNKFTRVFVIPDYRRIDKIYLARR